MKKFVMCILSLSIFSISSISFAYSNPDESGVCYFFSNNKLKERKICIISTGGAAGGYYTNLEVNNKNYSFETSTMDEVHKSYYKNQLVKSYLRDGTFYNKISKEEAKMAHHLLYCYQTKDKKLDICHN